MIKPKYTTYSLIEEQNVMREMMGLSLVVEQRSSSTKTRDRKEGSEGLIHVITNKKPDKWGNTTYNLILSKTKRDFGGTVEPGDEVYEKIENEVGDLTGKEIQLSSTPKKILGRDRWTFKLVDKAAPPPSTEEIKALDVVNSTIQPDLQKAFRAGLTAKPPSDAVGATSTEQPQEKILTLTGDKSWEYKVEDEIWYTRKQGSDGKWISLKTNKKAKSILDKKFPDAREAQEEIPVDAVEGTLQECGAATWDIEPLGDNRFSVRYTQEALFSKEPKQFEITTQMDESQLEGAQTWSFDGGSYWDDQMEGDIETQKTDNTKSMEFILDMNPKAGYESTEAEHLKSQPYGAGEDTGGREETDFATILKDNIKLQAIPMMIEDGALVKNDGCAIVASEAVLPEDAVASTMSEGWAGCPCMKDLPEVTMKSGKVVKKLVLGDKKAYIFKDCRAFNPIRKWGKVDCKRKTIIYKKDE